jgi:hypothetical protein
MKTGGPSQTLEFSGVRASIAPRRLTIDVLAEADYDNVLDFLEGRFAGAMAAAAAAPRDHWRDRFYLEQRVAGWLAPIEQALDLTSQSGSTWQTRPQPFRLSRRFLSRPDDARSITLTWSGTPRHSSCNTGSTLPTPLVKQ